LRSALRFRARHGVAEVELAQLGFQLGVEGAKNGQLRSGLGRGFCSGGGSGGCSGGGFFPNWGTKCMDVVQLLQLLRELGGSLLLVCMPCGLGGQLCLQARFDRLSVAHAFVGLQFGFDHAVRLALHVVQRILLHGQLGMGQFELRFRTTQQAQTTFGATGL
jgi:hypothetical protein